MTGLRRHVLVPAALVAGVLVVWFVVAGSSGSGENGDAADDGAGQVTVLAAASLTESFEELRSRVERNHPGMEIVLSFGPSSGLVEQVLAGARADVLATADVASMRRAERGGALSGSAEIFARNSLVLVVPPGNPGEVHGLADLSRDELRVAICEQKVPCGAATRELAAHAGVDLSPDTLATDVKEALAFVTLGEADVAVVYRTDAIAAGESVDTLDPHVAESVTNDYPVAAIRSAPNPEAAALVVDAITGDPGQAILRSAGFLEP